jgi:hypothetical protein
MGSRKDSREIAGFSGLTSVIVLGVISVDNVRHGGAPGFGRKSLAAKYSRLYSEQSTCQKVFSIN